MCGIVGAVAKRPVADFLVDGLRRLEYRGYDSAGIAVHDGQSIQRLRRVGRVQALHEALQSQPLRGFCGIGHTRWATHGGVNEPNAHPHLSGDSIAVVHNGIIENFEEERQRLQALGYAFQSQTDTEVIAHAIHWEFQQDGDLFNAVGRARKRFRGAYAIAALALSQPGQLVLARSACPLLLAFADEACYVASDVSALIAHSRNIMYLEDGDLAQIGINGLERLEDGENRPVQRAISQSQLSLASLELGSHQHYMQKEIHEQPQALAATAEIFLEGGFEVENFGAEARPLLQNIDSIKILACGTSYYAGLTAKHWLEAIAGLPTDVEIASEFRYRSVVANPRQLIITLSQSGETLDTMEALRYAQSLGQTATLSICNVMESALPRASRLRLYTRAGVEVGVASTKAFTTQLLALFGLAVTLAKLRGRLSLEAERQHQEALRLLPNQVQHALNLEPQIRAWAAHFVPCPSVLFLGRGLHYPIALEGALKLKEISYIHAEAYPAGELKHGPLALVDEQMPVVVIAPGDALLEKIKANMKEVAARGGKLFVFSDVQGQFAEEDGLCLLRTPQALAPLSPIVQTVPVQLLAYHVALAKGTDVDKPRNLAKAVTVE